MNNEKQMTLAWVMYADDFNQNLVPNVGDGQGTFYTPSDSWCYGNVSGLPDETNTIWLTTSLLGPYTKSIGVYKCPQRPRRASRDAAGQEHFDEQLHERQGRGNHWRNRI